MSLTSETPLCFFCPLSLLLPLVPRKPQIFLLLRSSLYLKQTELRIMDTCSLVFATIFSIIIPRFISVESCSNSLFLFLRSTPSCDCITFIHSAVDGGEGCFASKIKLAITDEVAMNSCHLQILVQTHAVIYTSDEMYSRLYVSSVSKKLLNGFSKWLYIVLSHWLN